MSILKISNLSQMFEDKVLFKNASLAINNGEHVGIVGLNGAGKSTFINIIARKIIWDEGEVIWLNGVRYGYLDQHADIDRSLTVYEYLRSSFAHLDEQNDRLNALYEKMGEADGDELDKLIEKSNRLLEKLTDEGYYDIDATIRKLSTGLGVAAMGFDTVIANLSGGQRAKLMLTKLLLQDLDVMLLDEPTNFLDVEHVDWLVKFLSGYKKTFMVISHDTDFLDKVCDNIVSIENGSIKKYSGTYTSFLAQHEMAVKQYAEDYERQQAEIKKMQDYIDRNKARAATAGMANSRKKMLDRIEVMGKPITIPDATFEFPCVQLHTKELIEVKNLEIGYDGVPLLPPISFTVQGDTKLWIRGTNGIGKTTLLKTLMHVIPPISGSYRFHIAAKPAYLEQDLTFRNLQTNAYGYISDCFPRFNQKEVRSQLARVGIIGDTALKEIFHLSGGEQVRIRLLTLMNTTSNVLILDEPTNHLDVRAKKALQEALSKYDGALVLVSHERSFAEALCNSVFDVKE